MKLVKFSSMSIDLTIRQLSVEVPSYTADTILLEEDPPLQCSLITQWVLQEDVIVIIAFSGGKDSIAMVLQMLELGVPAERIELWHHEVDGRGEQLFDWECTTSYCQAFADAFGLKLLFSYIEGGIVREIFRQNETSQPVNFQEVPFGKFTQLPAKQDAKYRQTRLKFPAVSADLASRWCSSKVKIDVMSKAINNSPRLKNAQICILTGERRAESTARSTYFEIERYRSFTHTRKALVWRSIIDWSDARVWGIMEKYLIQPHPAYMLGWSRCSCKTCIFNSPNTWASIIQIDPKTVNRLRSIESQIGFTLYSKQTLMEKAAKGKSFITDNMDYWIEQANGEFTAPIIVDIWQLPIGAKRQEQSGAI